MMINLRKFLTASVLLACLSGCTLIPDRESPPLPVPAQYPAGEAYDLGPIEKKKNGVKAGRLAWQNFFQDETLKDLIALGLSQNRDLKEATLNIAATRARYGIERSDFFPEFSADGSYVRQRNIPTGVASQPGTGEGDGTIVEYYRASLGLSAYELDLFGRVRSLNEAALNQYLATRSARQAVRVSLIANIATAYVNLKADQALLELADETLEARRESFELIELRSRKGVASDLELRQAETLLHQARFDRLEFINSVARDKNALRLLLGTPESIPRIGKAPDDPQQFDDYVHQVPAGLPSDLLTSRPDIMEAEYRLWAANADIGAARAAFFPRISLTGSIGYTATELSNLFESEKRFWQFSPQISVPIFTGGRLSNSLDLAEIRKEIAVVDYERSIEIAFREVADALAAVSISDERVQAIEDLVQSATAVERLSQLRYETGVESYLTVLDARRELYAARQQVIRQNTARTNARIALYRALGGGGRIETAQVETLD